jgi:hypothetical protein
MDNDKSILEKITDKVRNIANIAANAANEALKPEATPPKVDEYSAANIPLAADGLVSDPVMVRRWPSRLLARANAPLRNAR